MVNHPSRIELYPSRSKRRMSWGRAREGQLCSPTLLQGTHSSVQLIASTASRLSATFDAVVTICQQSEAEDVAGSEERADVLRSVELTISDASPCARGPCVY